uniref:ATP-dependent Clp protease proteolytic subunit n=1 Tax=Incarvillea sinensis TaxID=291312 RepID=A0A866VYU3_9LAMI|nr:clp protease proteolytic subunit [Incarvillea sinensis]QOE76737.1 clp protease proteolytic subunit [Incarvillea sinensis]
MPVGVPKRTREFFIFINSPGGSVVSGLAIYDLMQVLPPDMNTVAMGTAASMASLILSGGSYFKRSVFPTARVMIHQPLASFFSKTPTGHFIFDAAMMRHLRRGVTEAYVNQTSKPFFVIAEDLEKDISMTAEEASAYGLADWVGIDPTLFERISKNDKEDAERRKEEHEARKMEE